MGDVVISDLKNKPRFAKYDKGMVGVLKVLIPNLEIALKHAQHLAAHPVWDDVHPNPPIQVHVLVNRLKAIANQNP